jgi:hypothetical protein
MVGVWFVGVFGLTVQLVECRGLRDQSGAPDMRIYSCNWAIIGKREKVVADSKRNLARKNV